MAAAVLDVTAGIFNKLPADVKKKCDTKQLLTKSERLNFKRKITEYLFEIGDTHSSTAEKVVKLVYSKYGEAFSVVIGKKKWDNGEKTLLVSVLNEIQFKKAPEDRYTKKRKNEEADSDDEEINRRNKRLRSKNDEYGCAQYSPKILENEKSQEEKRLKLSSMFLSPQLHSSSAVKELMAETYATQRAMINAKDRNLSVLLTNWPFLKDPDQLINHASTLLGMDVTEVWSASLLKKCSIIRRFIKGTKKLKNKETEELDNIFAESKEAVTATGTEKPKFSVVFLALLFYFEEKSSSLFKVINVSFFKLNCIHLRGFYTCICNKLFFSERLK